MISPLQKAGRFHRDETGATAVEFALISGILIALSLGALELSLGFFQYNSAQQAARMAARIAATSDPVAGDLKSMTGLGGGIVSGDPMPAYDRICTAKTGQCSSGTYSADAMNAIYYGPDQDGLCAPTQKLRQGLCDVAPKVALENLTVEYHGSGFGVAGNPAVLSPVVTVRLTDMKFNFLVVDAFLPSSLTNIPTITVSVMAEDLRTNS